jgi:hypothetical protein
MGTALEKNIGEAARIEDMVSLIKGLTVIRDLDL